ncbi:MAG TPA: ABC transporter substrate-binding protein, partial [Ktedonosporobacter sp.]|nr:ABC transporter substrate-binding protein [Ktedonosporobacter sp.]
MMKRLILSFITLFVLILAGCGNGGSGGGATSNGGGGAQQGLTGGNSYIGCPGNTSTTAAAPESGT